jgi:hypothetical protein
MLIDANSFLWLVNLILTALLGMLGWFVRSIDARITKLEAVAPIQSERLATIEAHYVDILSRLDRIADKLDDLKH